MEKIDKDKLEKAAYVVILCIAIPLVFLSFWINGKEAIWPTFSNYLIELSGGFIGAGVLYFLLTKYFLFNDSNNALNDEAISKISTSIINGFANQSSDISSVHQYTGKEALLLLSEKILFAKFVQNTRFFSSDFESDYSPYIGDTQKWLKAVIQSINSGAVFREVVSNSASNISIGIIKELNNSKKKALGEFKSVSLAHNEEILNFTIIKFKDNTKEVWFGWIIHPGKELEQPVFMTKNVGIVTLFEDWHTLLFKRGKKLN